MKDPSSRLEEIILEALSLAAIQLVSTLEAKFTTVDARRPSNVLAPSPRTASLDGWDPDRLICDVCQMIRMAA